MELEQAPPAPPPASTTHERKARRERTLLSGRLYIGPNLFELPCQVRDLSDAGARVRIAPGQSVPDDLWFMEIRTGLAHRARVAWRAYPELGLDFTQSADLNQPVGKDLRILQRIWHAIRR